MPEMSNIKTKDRCILTADHFDGFFRHHRGEVGRVLSIYQATQYLVEFEGYEAERARQQQMVNQDGEGDNVVPYLSLIPQEKLRRLHDSDTE